MSTAPTPQGGRPPSTDELVKAALRLAVAFRRLFKGSRGPAEWRFRPSREWLRKYRPDFAVVANAPAERWGIFGHRDALWVESLDCYQLRRQVPRMREVCRSLAECRRLARRIRVVGVDPQHGQFDRIVREVCRALWVVQPARPASELWECAGEGWSVHRICGLRPTAGSEEYVLTACPPPAELLAELRGWAKRVAGPFVPTPCQDAILATLNGRALRQSGLTEATGYEGRELQRPSGLKELISRGMVCHSKRLGYYRPDAPPPEFRRGE